MVGTTTRSDGKPQVTYLGHPLAAPGASQDTSAEAATTKKVILIAA